MSTYLQPIKDKAILLRKSGYSYGKIQKELNLKSKGTLSVWLRNIQLTKENKDLLKKNTELAKKRGLLNFNTERKNRIKNENHNSFNNGFKLIPKKLNRKDLLLIGTSLYWGEGTKSWSKESYSRFSFANSDPKMIAVCMRFLREILEIPDNKIKCGIHLYHNTDIDRAKKFWSEIANLDQGKFYITKQISRASSGIRKAILPNGTFQVRVNNRLVFHKTKGLIDGLIYSLKV